MSGSSRRLLALPMSGSGLESGGSANLDSQKQAQCSIRSASSVKGLVMPFSVMFCGLVLLKAVLLPCRMRLIRCSSLMSPASSAAVAT